MNKLLWLVKRAIGKLFKAVITSRMEEGDTILDGPFIDDVLNDTEESNN